MILWLDAQLPPVLAPWIQSTFGIECWTLREVGLRDAEDLTIFQAARAAGVIVLTKDRDFIDLLKRLGPPPQVLWLTCGNTSNAHLRTILAATIPAAIILFARGESLVEISDPDLDRNGRKSPLI